ARWCRTVTARMFIAGSDGQRASPARSYIVPSASPIRAMRITRHCIPALLAVLLLSTGCASITQTAQTAPIDAPVRNIILLIADGAGVGVWTAAAYAREDLAVKRMPVVGLVDTRSASGKVTDSAAGASVYAT